MADVLGTTITFSGGYGNVNGGVSDSDIDWLENAPQIAALIVRMNVTWFVAMDLPDTNNAYGPLIQNMPSTWGLVLGKGNIQLLYRKDMYTVVSVLGNRLDDDKWVIKWQLQDTVSGVRFWVMGAQLTSGGENTVTRIAQTKQVISHTSTIQNGILCVDRYSSTEAQGYPVDIFTDAGWLGLKEQSATTVVSGDV